MQIGVLAIGSQGDVQPLAALGRGLVDRGHRVRFLTHRSFEGLAGRCGLEFAAIPGNPVEIVQGAEGQAWLSSGGNSLLFLRRFAQIARELITEVSEVAVEEARGCDALLFGLPLAPVGYSVAELLGIPGIPCSLYPVRPTGEFPPVLVPRPPLRSGWTNRLIAGAIVALYCALIRRLHDRWRRAAGLDRFPNLLAAFDRQGVPYLHGYSPALIPTPADWSDRDIVSGYWFLESDEEWKAPQALESFLEAGAPPVYVGFGSMAVENAAETTAVVVEALRRTGQRAILAAGWGGLAEVDLPGQIYHLPGFVPHDWLFPRVRMVVHHGGAGTTAAALRAGVPSLIVPFFADQYFWGETVARLGVGSHPLPRKRLTTKRLEQALREVLDHPEVSERSRELGAAIRSEKGVAAGAEAVESYLRSTIRLTNA